MSGHRIWNDYFNIDSNRRFLHENDVSWIAAAQSFLQQPLLWFVKLYGVVFHSQSVNKEEVLVDVFRDVSSAIGNKILIEARITEGNIHEFRRGHVLP